MSSWSKKFGMNREIKSLIESFGFYHYDGVKQKGWCRVFLGTKQESVYCVAYVLTFKL